MNKPRFAVVCVDVLHDDVDRLFHYAVPPALAGGDKGACSNSDVHVPKVEITAGARVLVPFGRGNGLKTGYVTALTDEPPSEVPPARIKSVHSLCDSFPVLTAETLELALWMKQKYYTTLAACIRCIIPSAKADGRFSEVRKQRAEGRWQRPEAGEIHASPLLLTAEQETALKQIIAGLDEEKSPPLLLHGVTGSGKTEVYLNAIERVLAEGRQAIVLVPEIALTPQMVQLFTARFGSAVAVTHSRLTPGERFQIWKRALDGELGLVIGPRSAVFTPFTGLGLVVIDEEHEHTYHSETTPKYDARAVAVKRAELSGGMVVLGSATPSLESYYRGQKAEGGGRSYSLARLTERVNKQFPEVRVIDMRREMARGNASIFAEEFSGALDETLQAGRQAILFLNRRGHSSYVSCRWCGHVLSCDRCRVNHTYHADGRRLLCHYCGRGTNLPANCPACGSEHIKRYGTGTQKVEEEMARLFPEAKTLRMDMDTTRGKHGHAKVLDAFRKGEAQVLIGTQMVAKGLDFPKVTMVGVVAADMSLFTGDFRAGEYTFQLLTQVAGRAGRATDAGQVFIQTYNPGHYAIVHAQKGDYEAFYKHEMALRQAMNYPPFSHVFSVMLTGPKEREVVAALQKLAAIADYCNKRDNKNRFEIIGISPAFVSMVKKQYRWKLLVKCGEEQPLVAFIKYCVKKLRENDPLTDITVHLTLNPIMME